MARCKFIKRKRKDLFPCSNCKYKGKCETSGGSEPLTCLDCRYYRGAEKNDKQACYRRKGYNIRPCEDFEWS